jgi:hypothetical protein
LCLDDSKTRIDMFNPSAIIHQNVYQVIATR